MSRDIEIGQVLRAYRNGLISEAAFEEERSRLEQENGAPSQTPAFEAFGRPCRQPRNARWNSSGR